MPPKEKYKKPLKKLTLLQKNRTFAAELVLI
jgi:hypothetical protein